MAGESTDAAAAVTASGEHPVRWRRGAAFAIGSVGAVAFAAVGLLLSRPDAVALALPLAIWCAAVAFRPAGGMLRLTLSARPGTGAGEVDGWIDAEVDADWVQIAVDQAERRTGTADAAPGEGAVRTQALLRHSGPSALLAATARAVRGDGVWTSEAAERVELGWNAVPRTLELPELPVPHRLFGLHGAHRGRRLGSGGDFRDIHPFVPGDELRRVDWRATARAARRPGDLLVRRTDSPSEATAVIAIDTAEDLGAVVAGWGQNEPETSGTTSLDIGREAALSIADAAIAAGDRVAYFELATNGRSVLAGSGARHRARLRRAVAATGPAEDAPKLRRTPPVPHGAMICVLSTFFDGAAAQLAMQWQRAGHRVVAIDVLPVLDAARLTRDQVLALRTLTAERANIMAELRHVGIDVVRWAAGAAATELRMAARSR